MHPAGILYALALCLPLWAACVWLAPLLTLGVFGVACVGLAGYAVGHRRGVEA